MSDSFQEECLWLNTIMYVEPAIKVYLPPFICSTCEPPVCMRGATLCINIAVMYAFTRTHVNTRVSFCNSCFSSPSSHVCWHGSRSLILINPSAYKRGDSSLPVLFSQLLVTGSITGSSILLSFTITRPSHA